MAELNERYWNRIVPVIKRWFATPVFFFCVLWVLLPMAALYLIEPLLTWASDILDPDA
jgi:hypothetical protein